MAFIPQLFALFLLIFGFGFHFNAQAKSLQFGTSTFEGEQQNVDWREMLVKKSSNWHNSRLLTFSMDRTYRASCTSAQCTTSMEWERHAVQGKDGQNCEELSMDEGIGQLWHSFTPIYQPQPFNANPQNNMLGLAISLSSLSINIFDDNLPKKGIEFPKETTKMLFLLLSAPPSPNWPRIMANAQIIRQIGQWMNATKRNGEGGDWTMQNCENDGEMMGRKLEIEENGGEENVGGKGRIRLELAAHDLVYQSNDENEGTCLLAISDFGDDQSASQNAGEFSMILSIWPRQCLLVDFAHRKLAFVQRKWQHQGNGLGDEGSNGNEEIQGTIGQDGKNGQQKRREVSNWLSFVFSLI